MITLTFQNTTLSVINQHNQVWFSASDVGNALGYSQAVVGVTKLYNAHADEFTPNMTALINMQTNGGMQKVRIFSLRGAHLIGMLSHTKVAKDFRRWVLDILDQEVERQDQQQLALPEPEKTFTLNWTESELKHFASFWCAAFEMHQMLKYLDPILEQLGSKFSARVHSQVREYKRTLDSMHYRVSRDIDPLQYADPHNGHWQYCLNTINSYKRTAPKIALR